MVQIDNYSTTVIYLSLGGIYAVVFFILGLAKFTQNNGGYNSLTGDDSIEPFIGVSLLSVVLGTTLSGVCYFYNYTPRDDMTYMYMGFVLFGFFLGLGIFSSMIGGDKEDKPLTTYFILALVLGVTLPIVLLFLESANA